MHDNSKLLFAKYATPYFKPGIRVLEIGAQTHTSTYRALIPQQNISWDTLDIKPGEGITHVAISAYSYPIASNTYDVVLAGQVLEHVRHPWRWFPELARIAAVDGLVITVSPISWPYHEAPVDCWRIYPEGIKSLCEEASLTVLTCVYSSEESLKYWRTRYGRGRVSESRRSLLKYSALRILSFVGYPVEVALDLILVAKKR